MTEETTEKTEEKKDEKQAKPTASREERLAVEPGMIIRVHQRIRDVSKDGKERERTQVFEGVVLGRRGGATMGATTTVRKKSGNVGVEKIFPLFLPTIEKIEIKGKGRVRRAKLAYLRDPRQKLKKPRASKK
jgi:large subunit ribosomal protein L19